MGQTLHALAADPTALDAELRAHADALRGIARRLCRDATEAEDLVQDTLERALAGIKSFTPGTNARAWLVSILHHLFIDRCRRRAREGAAVQLDVVENRLESPVPEAEPRWAKLGKSDVEHALGKLDAPFRDAYRLYVDGASYEQISKTLGVPRATVGTRLLRARAKLKVMLFGEEEEPA